jgi:hypothetical protein
MTGAGIQWVLVSRDEEDITPIPKDILRTIAMVQVDIHNCQAGSVSSLDKVLCGYGDII